MNRQMNEIQSRSMMCETDRARLLQFREKWIQFNKMNCIFMVKHSDLFYSVKSFILHYLLMFVVWNTSNISSVAWKVTKLAFILVSCSIKSNLIRNYGLEVGVVLIKISLFRKMYNNKIETSRKFYQWDDLLQEPEEIFLVQINSFFVNS